MASKHEDTMAASFYWHDYETFGTDPRRDRPAQFAGQRTSEDLEPIGPPLVLHCRPPADYLPQPDACLVTGLSPREVEARGLAEPAFARAIHDAMATPGTCDVGSHRIRFDDEFTRHLFYRNFFDPYAREYADGNSRWDLIDVVRLCYALRPEGLQWPEHEPGRPSFRLEDLAAANGLAHGQAHDALSDVEATIALARRLREAQPRLFAWALGLRSRRTVEAQLDLDGHRPVVHVSSRYPAQRGCLAVVAPICSVAGRRGTFVVFDLATDPTILADLSAEEIEHRTFSRAEDLEDGVERLPLKVVHGNKSPMIAPLGVLRDADHDRIGLDFDRCLEHARRLAALHDLAPRIQAAFAPPAMEGERDVEASLYDGFLPDGDRRQFAALRAATPQQLADFDRRFGDPRLRELLFRYRARHWPESLAAEEVDRWRTHCQGYFFPVDGGGDTAAPGALAALRDRVRQLADGADERERALLADIEAWSEERAAPWVVD